MREPRLVLLKDCWKTTRVYLLLFLKNHSRSQRFGPMAMPRSHMAPVFDDEEVIIDNLDEEYDTGRQERYPGEEFDVREVKGATWRAFRDRLVEAVGNGQVTAEDWEKIQRFFKNVRVRRIDSFDARTSANPEKYGWVVTLEVKASDDLKTYVKRVALWNDRGHEDLTPFEVEE